MSVPLEGLILAMFFWALSSAMCCTLLKSKYKGVGYGLACGVAVITLGVVSAFFFYLYERAMGRA